VLQADGGIDSRTFLRLPHPRNSMSLFVTLISLLIRFVDQPSLYLPYTPQQTPNNARTDGLLEVQKVEPNAKRSWFLDQTVLSGKSISSLNGGVKLTNV
jgi:hypothetical protein